MPSAEVFETSILAATRKNLSPLLLAVEAILFFNARSCKIRCIRQWNNAVYRKSVKHPRWPYLQMFFFFWHYDNPNFKAHLGRFFTICCPIEPNEADKYFREAIKDCKRWLRVWEKITCTRRKKKRKKSFSGATISVFTTSRTCWRRRTTSIICMVVTSTAKSTEKAKSTVPMRIKGFLYVVLWI